MASLVVFPSDFAIPNGDSKSSMEKTLNRVFTIVRTSMVLTVLG